MPNLKPPRKARIIGCWWRRSLWPTLTALAARPCLWPCSPAAAAAGRGSSVLVLSSKERRRDCRESSHKVNLCAPAPCGTCQFYNICLLLLHRIMSGPGSLCKDLPRACVQRYEARMLLTRALKVCYLDFGTTVERSRSHMCKEMFSDCQRALLHSQVPRAHGAHASALL